MKVCTKCKIEQDDSAFYKKKKDSPLLRQECISCTKKGNASREHKYSGYRKKYREENLERDRSKRQLYYLENKERIDKQHKDYRETVKYRFISYRNNAAQRNHEFLLTEEQFYTLIETPSCYYCGREVYVGVDRLDSDKGYTLENCVPCCSVCNRIKNVFSERDFLSQIKLIYENRKL